MMDPCYSIVMRPQSFESSNEIVMKKRIEGNNANKCRAALEDLLQNMLDGEKFPTNLMMPVINRYQMNRFGEGIGTEDKTIKKLLYLLWDILPKRGPDGKFLDRMVMVCGAFDKDLKHPNQYVCGSVLRTLSKTKEPEVIRELVHSIEKCLEWSHAYQRKYAVLAIASIYKNFPDLNPSAPKLIAEYLLKETDDECKRAALQALLVIAPEEAKSYLHSCNITDIHCMNASIQFLFVELIQRLYKKGSEESESYIMILTSLIKSSLSPSVRYQASMAASALMRTSRKDNTELIKVVASCFIDTCAKDSENNVKLISLDSLMKLRDLKGADRVLRSSVMDILSILQSATDLELHEKIVKLCLDLASPYNIGGIVAALRQELRKLQDKSVLCSQQETFRYRRLLVDAVHKISEKYPHAIVEHEMLDSLFELLVSSSIGERTSSRLIMLFEVFISNNPAYQSAIVRKIQECFNLAKDNTSTHRGLIQLLGDFSETKEQIEESYKIIKESLGELPIVMSELRKSAQANAGSGDLDDREQSKSNSPNGDVDMVTKKMNRLVTADGSYAAQSAINFQNNTAPAEILPPLRSYYLRAKFDTASILCQALLKMACRYQQSQATKAENHKMIARFMFIIGSILELGHSSLTDNEANHIRISSEHSEALLLALEGLRCLSDDSQSEVALLMKKLETVVMRSQLGLVVKNLEQGGFSSDTVKETYEKSKFDDEISISLFANRDEDLGFESDDESKDDVKHLSMLDMLGQIPLSGTGDAINAYCEFDVNQYDIEIKIYLENRSDTKTFENVTVELADRNEVNGQLINKPDPIVLAPRKTVACVIPNIKVVSAENKHLFGCITFDDSHTSREHIIMLNDINVNITDYIKPSSINFDDFRDIWRDCEWENKVNVKTSIANLKEYLTHLVVATNMRCVTSVIGSEGECNFLSANLYACSSFGKEALANVSIVKESPTSLLTGSVKIRSRSQGMALSLGEKIKAAQSSSIGSGDR